MNRLRVEPAEDQMLRFPGCQPGEWHDAEAREDARLLAAIGREDAEALAALYRCRGGMLYSLLVRMLVSDMEAQEILQDTFVQIWRRARDFDPRRASAMAWIIMVARGLAIDRLRARARRSATRAAYEKEVIPDSVTIPAGRDSAEIAVNPLGLRESRVTKTVTLNLNVPVAIPLESVMPYEPNPIVLLPPIYLYPVRDYIIGVPSEATVYLDGSPGRSGFRRVQITAPQNGQMFTAASDIAISVESVDNGAPVGEVEIFDGTRRIAEIQNPKLPGTLVSFSGGQQTFGYVWTNAPPETIR